MKRKKAVRVWPKQILNNLVIVCSHHHLAEPLKIDIIKENDAYLVKVETCQYCKDLSEAKGVSTGNAMRRTIEELQKYSIKLEKAYKKSTRTK